VRSENLKLSLYSLFSTPPNNNNIQTIIPIPKPSHATTQQNPQFLLTTHLLCICKPFKITVSITEFFLGITLHKILHEQETNTITLHQKLQPMSLHAKETKTKLPIVLILSLTTISTPQHQKQFIKQSKTSPNLQIHLLPHFSCS
jgi:hypothetical protein